MVPCALAQQLAGRLGSFFKLRRRGVARFPGLLADTTPVIRWLRLLQDRRHGQSEPLVDTGDAELLASGPRAKPALGRKGGHRSPGQRRALIFSERSVMASQPNSSAKKKEEKGKNIQVVVRCR